MKILIIRFSSIGDIVLTTPVVRCVKQQIKNCELHFLTKQQYAEILNPNPYIDKIHAVKKDVSEVAAQLKSEKFDFIIDLHHNLRSAQVKRSLKIKSHSFKKLNIGKWLAVNLKMKKILPGVHVV